MLIFIVRAVGKKLL